MINFHGKARRLDEWDFGRIAQKIGVTEDHVRAVVEIEAAGGGFDLHGRPKMLFEPHVFHRVLLDEGERARAVELGLAYPRWGERPYPRDSYPRFQAAAEINREAAFKAASWGLGQILGTNHEMVGYETAEDMVMDFLDDEETHLEVMIDFIVAAGLDDDLRREDWRGFARGYNGPGYAKHNYHGRLAAAYRRWQARPDAAFELDRSEQPANPPEAPIRATRGRVLRSGMRGGDIRLLQMTLRDLGHMAGPADGIFGPMTKRAVLSFQAHAEIAADGVVGEETWAALESAQPLPERDVSERDLRKGGSRIIRGADAAETAAAGAAVIPFLGEAMEIARQAEGVVDWAAEFFGENWLPILGAAGLLLLVLIMTDRIRKARVEDARTGRHVGR